MAEIGIILAEKLIEVIGSEIIKEICDMWGYKSQLDELNNTVSTIKNVLLDADSKRELSQEARGYIAKLKDVVYDADDLFDEFFTLAELKLLDGNKDHKFLKKVNHFFSGKKKEVSQAYRMSRQVKDIKEQLNSKPLKSLLQIHQLINMSGKCGNCNCADSTQCVNKGNQYGIDTVAQEVIFYDGMVMEGGNCDSCKCGASCACTSCSCCSH